MEDEARGMYLPDWYRIERESEKTIGMIRDISELEFYSENPDRFIRRLAIIRAGELGSREAFSMLVKVVDDPLECDWNRALAGAYMQKINDALDLGYYGLNRYVQEDRAGSSALQKHPLPVVDSQPAIRYEFSKSMIESQLNMDRSFLRINLDNREFSFNFQIGSWLVRLCRSFAEKSIIGVKKVFTRICAMLPVIARAIFVSLPQHLVKGIIACGARFGSRDGKQGSQKNREKSNVKIAEDRMEEMNASSDSAEAFKPWEQAYEQPRLKRIAPVRYKRTRPRRIPFFIGGGMILRQLLMIITSPLRFILRHKVVTLGSLLAIYLFISLTIPGKALLERVSPRFYEENERFIQNVGRHTVEALHGRLFIETPVPDISTVPAEIKRATRYSVTAPKGLYLRDKPAYEGEKITLMKMSTIVEYLDEKSVAQDVVWLRIRLADGTAGWANAEWLKEVSDG